MSLLLLSLACSATDAPPDETAGVDTQVTDTSGADSGGSELDTSLTLNGNWAAEPTPAPEFDATNRDGTARSRPDLIGHPTVVWFYPAASTAG